MVAATLPLLALLVIHFITIIITISVTNFITAFITIFITNHMVMFRCQAS